MESTARLMRAIFFLPSSLFCGIRLAQEHRCFDEGNTDIFGKDSDQGKLDIQRRRDESNWRNILFRLFGIKFTIDRVKHFFIVSVLDLWYASVIFAVGLSSECEIMLEESLMKKTSSSLKFETVKQFCARFF